MENMDAMHYEYFIRRVYQVGRFGIDGANADDFRDLEHSQGLFLSEKKLKEEGNPKQWNKSLTQLEKEYTENLQKIAGYVQAAIRVAVLNYSSELSEQQIRELEGFKKLLDKRTMENICTAIKGADEILLSIGLYPQ